MTKEVILKFLKTKKNDFYNRYGITKIALYGSYALNKANKNSDIDLLIHTNKKFIDIEAFKDELHNHFHKNIDILNESNIIMPTIKKMILKNSIYV